MTSNSARSRTIQSSFEIEQAAVGGFPGNVQHNSHGSFSASTKKDHVGNCSGRGVRVVFAAVVAASARWLVEHIAGQGTACIVSVAIGSAAAALMLHAHFGDSHCLAIVPLMWLKALNLSRLDN